MGVGGDRAISAFFLREIIVQLCYQRKLQLNSSRVKSGRRVYGNTLEIISTQISKVSFLLFALARTHEHSCRLAGSGFSSDVRGCSY